MKLTRAQKVRLGTFMLTGILLFFGALLALTGLKMWEERDAYTVYFIENVGGLEPGAPVKYQGLRVGRVDGMRIAPEDPGAIEVSFSLVEGTVLHEGAKAVLDTSGLTGLKTINLTPGDPRDGRIEPGSRLPAGESLVDRLTGKAEDIAIKVEMAANNLVKWTRDENRRRVEKLVDSATQLSQEIDLFLATNRVPMKDALNSVAGAAEAFTEVAADADLVRADVGHTLEEARVTLREYRRPIEKVDPEEVAQTVAAARKAMQSLDGRLSDQQLGLAIDELLVALTDLTALLQNADLTIRAGREDFVATLKYVRQAAEDLREFSRIIAQNPSALLSGRE